ncbi:solute carrier family 22 member 6 isoform X4 [Perca fluviatilis]|uniref:solute carrier family 22 member 6 isoform X4 n=1 Tax=Perca fluviatilis TaxID=8168 RepID=UPI001963668B|nr:solute carrier family 22 member 6 isoform X4 [Perca fluviatilis]
MAFGDLLEQVGSTGRFQILHVTLLCMPVLLMASHNLLQNFVAAVPPHYCNAHTNLSQSQLSPEETLLITVPQDQIGKPQRCQRYVTPQWHLLNGSSGSGEDGDTKEGLDVDLQGCTDGWSYNMTDMSSTIISDWHLVCDLRSLKQMGQTVYMGGVLVGAVVFGGLSDRWFHESSRWLVMSNKPEQAIKNLKRVANFNGRREEGDKIDIKMLRESMTKEMSCSQGSYSVLDLFRTPTMRTMTICLSAVWFSTSFAYYGLAMDLQKFGVDIYLIQVIFGAVDIPAKVVITVSMSFIGRRPSQCGGLILAGVTILINLLVPYDKTTARTCLAVLGKGCLAASFNCCYLYSGELYPTIIRQNGMGWVSMMARIGAMVAPMVLLTGEYIPWLPGLIYGGAPILSGVAAIFLPETLGSPLPDTIEDVEDRGSGRNSKMPPKEAIILQDTQANLLKQAA